MDIISKCRQSNAQITVNFTDVIMRMIVTTTNPTVVLTLFSAVSGLSQAGKWSAASMSMNSSSLSVAL